jgi:hypothetical protein
MKYIRTKDGKIYDFADLYVCEELCGKPYGVKDSGWCIYRENIIQQADTIEELCDEFVLHYDDTMQRSIPIPWATYERRDDNWQKHKEKLISELERTERKATVYGAIWTEKGLKYVAQFNGMGELELL